VPSRSPRFRFARSVPRHAPSGQARTTRGSRLLLAASAFGCLVGASPGLIAAAHAGEPPAPTLSAADEALVARAATYIEGLHAVEGRFVQIDPKGAEETGRVYLQRPGKARFQYDPPAQLLVVSDGDTVSIYDRKLKSFDQYPLNQTPLALLLASNLHWDRAVVITSVDRTPGGFTIEAKDAHKVAQGRIAFAFSDAPLALKGWTVVDAQNQKTEVRLGPLKARTALDPRLFTLAPPAGSASPP